MDWERETLQANTKGNACDHENGPHKGRRGSKQTPSLCCVSVWRKLPLDLGFFHVGGSCKEEKLKSARKRKKRGCIVSNARPHTQLDQERSQLKPGSYFCKCHVLALFHEGVLPERQVVGLVVKCDHTGAVLAGNLFCGKS